MEEKLKKLTFATSFVDLPAGDSTDRLSFPLKSEGGPHCIKNNGKLTKKW